MSRSSVPNNSLSLQALPQVLPQSIALYMRVSTEDQADRGTIEAQRDFLRQFASLYQLPVVDEYADDGVTGTLPLGERPEGRRLLQDAEAGRFGCVLVYRLTRLGRSLKALIEAHDTLAHYGVTIRSAMEPFDTSTPIGTFLFQLLSSLAELDRAQILDQLTRGRDRVARQGKWTGGLVPYGYMVDTGGLLIPSTRLVEVLGMTEADVVRDLYARIAAGSSGLGEAQRLNALGVPTTRYYSNETPREGKMWHPGPVASLIASPIYRGVHTLMSRHGEIERQVFPLVDEALWSAANAQLQRNRRLPKSNATRTYLLRGLITCGLCKSNYVGQVYRNVNNPPGVYYRCGGGRLANYANRTDRCGGKTIHAAWIEQIVWEDCRYFIRHPAEALAAAQEQLKARQQQVSTMMEERIIYLRALAEKSQERDRVMTMFQRGRLPLKDAEARLDVIAQEEATLRQQCAALDAQKALAEAVETHLVDAQLLLERLQERLDDIDERDDQATKRQVIESLVHHIRIDTDAQGEVTARITYAFSPERVAPNGTPRVGAHIADGVVLALHLGQQDLDVANEHCDHAPFGQLMGLRNLDKHAHPRRSSPCHRLHIRSDHLPEVGPDAATGTAARYVRQAGLDVGLRLRPGQGYLLSQVQRDGRMVGAGRAHGHVVQPRLMFQMHHRQHRAFHPRAGRRHRPMAQQQTGVAVAQQASHLLALFLRGDDLGMGVHGQWFGDQPGPLLGHGLEAVL
jgi:site-specific DNA recombinase